MKRLREETGCSLVDARKALLEANMNYVQAEHIIRTKGNA